MAVSPAISNIMLRPVSGRVKQKKQGRAMVLMLCPSLQENYSAVTGSMMVETLLTELAGNPPCLACSRTISSLGAL